MQRVAPRSKVNMAATGREMRRLLHWTVLTEHTTLEPYTQRGNPTPASHCLHDLMKDNTTAGKMRDAQAHSVLSAAADIINKQKYNVLNGKKQYSCSAKDTGP